jgi:hypothetical protein
MTASHATCEQGGISRCRRPAATVGRALRASRASPATLALSLAVVLAVVLVGGCGSTPPAPPWRSAAKADVDLAVSAYLSGDSRGEARAFERARGEVASTGQPALMARIELMRCAAHVASLDFTPCSGYQQWQRDAAPAELAYARYLAAQPLDDAQRQQLPPPQQPAAQALAGGGNGADAQSLQSIADPLARLISIGVLFEAGRASPAAIALAADTASAQGWRRPLLAWLGVQAMLAERAGDAVAAAALQRRIALVQASVAAPSAAASSSR